LWHLILNSLSFFYLFRALERYSMPRFIVFCSLLSAFIASFFCIYEQPVVGASGMVYAMVGMYFAILLKNRKKRKPATLPFAKGEYHRFTVGRGYFNISPTLVFVISVITFLTIGFFKTNIAAMLHLLSFIIGFTIMFILQLVNRNS